MNSMYKTNHSYKQFHLVKRLDQHILVVHRFFSILYNLVLDQKLNYSYYENKIDDIHSKESLFVCFLPPIGTFFI